MVLTEHKLCLPQASPSPIIVGDTEFASSAPVTPDPNSSSKSHIISSRIKHKPVSKKNNGDNSRGGSSNTNSSSSSNNNVRLNKFVRRLHDMLVQEKHSGIVEWRRGLLVLFSTDAFSKTILPKYFNTRNFKTFRRQLNYYGFVHVRSFSATGNTTTALWINQNLAEDEANEHVSAVLKLRRVEPNEVAKTVEGRRLRKELAIHTVEEDIGLDSKTLQLDQIRLMAVRGGGETRDDDGSSPSNTASGTGTSSTANHHRPIQSAASVFLNPQRVGASTSTSSTVVAQDDTSSSGIVSTTSAATNAGTIPQVDSLHSMSSTGSAAAAAAIHQRSYCGGSLIGDDACYASAGGRPITATAVGGGAPPRMLPESRDELTNTDAAASVLLMLSRS